MPFTDTPLPEDFEVKPIAPRKVGKPFGPDNPPRGRKKGDTAKITRDLKEGIITAAERIGSDGCGKDGVVGFLEDLGRYHKRAFSSLLVKLLPMQANVDVNTATYNTFRIIGIPSGQFLDKQQYEAATNPSASITIEHEAEPMSSDAESMEERMSRLGHRRVV